MFLFKEVSVSWWWNISLCIWGCYTAIWGVDSWGTFKNGLELHTWTWQGRSSAIHQVSTFDSTPFISSSQGFNFCLNKLQFFNLQVYIIVNERERERYSTFSGEQLSQYVLHSGYFLCQKNQNFWHSISHSWSSLLYEALNISRAKPPCFVVIRF